MRRSAVRIVVLSFLLLLAVTSAAPPAIAWGYGRYPCYGSRAYVGYHGGWGWSVGYGYGWPGHYGWPGYYGSPSAWAPRSSYGDRRDLPATVETKIKPKKALVTVDGVAQGTAGSYYGSWDVLLVDPGTHVIQFSSPGYKTFRTVLEAQPGASYRIGERLEKGEGLDPRSTAEQPSPEAPAASAPASSRTEDAAAPRESTALRTGLLWLDVSPDDAAVYLDGRFLGRADELRRLHGAIPLARGEHRIDVVMPGYESQNRRVMVGEDSPVELRVELRRGEANPTAP